MMILVAAAAVGFVGYRLNDAMTEEVGFGWGNGHDLEGWIALTGPGFAALTSWLIVVRLIPPRPPVVELFCQPGFVAACVALALTGRRFAEAVLADWFVPHDDWFLAMEWDDASQEASLGILTAWSVLALAGCLKTERRWIDRASRAVAITWVLAGIAARVVPLVLWYLFKDI